MSKAFVKETEHDDEADVEARDAAPPPGGKNYISRAGFVRLKAELKQLVEVERPEVVKTVSWAASNGDRSENGDYIYGKKRLREIDRRVRFLIKRLENAEVVDASGRDTDQVFFGATVRYASDHGEERTIRIIGVDEAESAQGEVSWIAPIARALLKARVGDEVRLTTPRGVEVLEVLEVRYPEPAPEAAAGTPRVKA